MALTRNQIVIIITIVVIIILVGVGLLVGFFATPKSNSNTDQQTVSMTVRDVMGPSTVYVILDPNTLEIFPSAEDDSRSLWVYDGTHVYLRSDPSYAWTWMTDGSTVRLGVTRDPSCYGQVKIENGTIYMIAGPYGYYLTYDSSSSRTLILGRSNAPSQVNVYTVG